MAHPVPVPVGALVKLKTFWLARSYLWASGGHWKAEQVYWPSGWAGLDLMKLVLLREGERELFGMILEWADVSALGSFGIDEESEEESGCRLIYRVLPVADSMPLWFPWTSIEQVKMDNYEELIDKIGK